MTASTAPLDGITSDPQQELYVIQAGDGYSCLGFDVALDEVRKLGTIYQAEDPSLIEGLDGLRGSMDVMARRQRALALMRANPSKMPELWLPSATRPVVAALLKTLTTSSQTIRLFHGNPITGQAWSEENDSVGRIGRSMGPMRIPLLVAAGEQGGGAIFPDLIVGIRDAKSNAWLYQSDNFFVPKCLVVEEMHTPSKGKPYNFSVYQIDLSAPDGLSLYARERTFKKARDLAEFMSGRAPSKLTGAEAPLTMAQAYDQVQAWIAKSVGPVQRWAEQLRADGREPLALNDRPPVAQTAEITAPRVARGPKL